VAGKIVEPGGRAGVLFSVTIAFGTATFAVSRTLIVTVTEVPLIKFAVLGVIVESVGEITVKSSVADGVMVTLLATAVSVAVPWLGLDTLNWTTPLTSEIGTPIGVIVSPVRSLVSVTDAPCSGALLESRTVTVTVLELPMKT
jgi:hypothetical protein